MEPELSERFRANHKRATDLIHFYKIVSSDAARDAPGLLEKELFPDLLRAAIVLLHASLEDLMRTAGKMRLPVSKPEVLKSIPCSTIDVRKTTMSLADLAAFRGLDVDAVIKEIVATYLDRKSYNDPTDLASSLTEMGLAAGLVSPHAAILMAMMKRRHHIAHQLDRDEGAGRSTHRALPVDPEEVAGWSETVFRFGLDVLGQLYPDSVEKEMVL